MRLTFNNFKILYDAPESSGGGGAPLGGDRSSGDIDDVIDFFGNDEELDKIDLNEPTDGAKPSKTKGKVKAEEDDAQPDEELDDEEDDIKEDDEEDIDDELEEDLKDDEEPDAEKLELVTPVRRKEILKKYPELFKDFPYLEKAYYREQQYTELLPTLDDAKTAVNKSQTLDRFEADLVKGNVETIFKAVKGEAPNSFAKIIDDLLPAIRRVDPEAFNHILSNTMKHTVASMAIEAKRSNNDQLRQAAAILNQFIFGTSDYKAPTRMSKDEKPDDKQTELERREQEFNKRQFETAKDGLNTKVNNTLRNTIEGNIDPRESMTPYVRKNAVREVSEQLQTLLRGDSRFTTIVDKLWEKAFQKNFSQESLDAIRSAYLSKARTLLPSVIKKARIEALKGMGKRPRTDRTNDNEREETNTKREGRSRPSDRSDKNKVPTGMSTLDFLNTD